MNKNNNMNPLPGLEDFALPLPPVPVKKSLREKHEDYDGFVEKFKPKKTTDDCYTPPEVYAEVLSWVDEELFPLKGYNIVRPFYPGGDYESEEYKDNDIVIDNPPFSILAKIIDYYVAHDVKFFLFAPALTLFTSPRPSVTYIVSYCEIKYENGAVVRTSFVTNLENRHRVMLAGDLYSRIKKLEKARAKQVSKSLPKYSYPDELITPALLGRLVVRGITFKIPNTECFFVRRLDCGAKIFGGGYLLSERMTVERKKLEAKAREIKVAEKLVAEKLAAERLAAEELAASRFELSEREVALIRALDRIDKENN